MTRNKDPITARRERPAKVTPATRKKNYSERANHSPKNPPKILRENNFNDPVPITGKKGYPSGEKLLRESQPLLY